MSGTVKTAMAASDPARSVKLGVGPRSAAFANLCGYDFRALAAPPSGDGESCVDILLPKHYFFHRGFDGAVWLLLNSRHANRMIHGVYTYWYSPTFFMRAKLHGYKEIDCRAQVC